jgi:hypothetical protein
MRINYKLNTKMLLFSALKRDNTQMVSSLSSPQTENVKRAVFRKEERA